MINIFKNKTKQLLSYNRDTEINSIDYNIFKYLFNNIFINDFVTIARENYLNKDYEDYQYIDLDYNVIYDIINDDIIKNLENVNCINLGSASGKIIFLLSVIYSFNEYVGIENMFELHQLSSYLLSKLFDSEYKDIIKDKNINFINDSLLSADLNNKNLIIVDYNNKNNVFNNMLENKIINEVGKGSKIIKIFTPFIKNTGLKLLKIKILKTANNKKILIYYYNKEK